METCLKYAEDFNMVTEPACGASFHLGYHPQIIERALSEKLSSDYIIVAIACRGSANTLYDLEKLLSKSQKALELPKEHGVFPLHQYESDIRSDPVHLVSP